MSVDPQDWFSDQVLVHEHGLRAFLGRYAAQPADLEDGVQETYARLLSMTAAARAGVRNWRAFVFTTARNVALDRFRRQRVISLDLIAELDASDVLQDKHPTAYEELNSRQELALLARAVAQLPERCRQVFTLRKLYGLSQKQIAAQLEITENTVEQHVAKGVRLVARFMFATVHESADQNQANTGAARGIGISSGQHQD